MSGEYDQREELYARGGFRPLSDGRPIGLPPKSAADARAHAVKQRDEEMRLAAEARTEPVMVRCSVCSYIWACAYLPLPLAVAADLMKNARCPKGCSGSIHLSNVPGV